MKRRVLTDEQKKFIVENYRKKPVSQMATDIKTTNRCIYGFMRRNELKTMYAGAGGRPHIDKKIKPGHFNVNEKENWLV